MSRVANDPIQLPGGVEVKLDGSELTVKGGLGKLPRVLTRVLRVHTCKHFSGLRKLSITFQLKPPESVACRRMRACTQRTC